MAADILYIIYDILFSNNHKTYMKIDQTLSHKINLNKLVI